MEDILLDGLQSLVPDPSTQRDFLQRMRRETERIHAVVRDLLDFARPESEAAGPQRPAEPADVRAVIDDVVALVRPQSPFRAVRLETEVAGAPRVALAGPRLTQVLLNLVLNAGGRDRVDGTRRPRHRPSARGSTAGCESRWRTTARGSTLAVRERLFEPFVTTKDVGEGTGLGLAVCRGLVEGAGGEIGLDASYEGGARFYVVVPAPDGD